MASGVELKGSFPLLLQVYQFALHISSFAFACRIASLHPLPFADVVPWLSAVAAPLARK